MVFAESDDEDEVEVVVLLLDSLTETATLTKPGCGTVGTMGVDGRGEVGLNKIALGGSYPACGAGISYKGGEPLIGVFLVEVVQVVPDPTSEIGDNGLGKLGNGGVGNSRVELVIVVVVFGVAALGLFLPIRFLFLSSSSTVSLPKERLVFWYPLLLPIFLLSL